MSSVDIATRNWAIGLEDRERARSGAPLPIARKAVARRLKIPPGTLENLRRGRIKGVRAWLVERVQSAFVRELELEIARLTHERQLVLQSGLGSHQEHAREVETHLATLHELMR